MLAYPSIGLTSQVYAAFLSCWSQKDRFRISKSPENFVRSAHHVSSVFVHGVKHNAMEVV